jgi:hypothetical protein
MMVSHIISSRNRATQLGVTLGKLECEAMRRRGVELVLVDSASNDNTFEVMTTFAQSQGCAQCRGQDGCFAQRASPSALVPILMTRGIWELWQQTALTQAPCHSGLRLGWSVNSGAPPTTLSTSLIALSLPD